MRLAAAPLALLLLVAAPLPAAAGEVVAISPELRVEMDEGHQVFLSARPKPDEGLDAFVRRLAEEPGARAEILAANGGRSRLRRDTFVRVPYGRLAASYRKIAMEALFPEDAADAGGWSHRVTAPGGRPESLWRIAEWFTGEGRRYREIREAGKIASLEMEKGQVVRIPAALLSPVFRSAAAAAAPAEPPLEFGSDEKGRYALYRLRRGEALYSAVVVRFTGRVHAEDVNEKAAEIAARSSIEDVRAIPVGFPVKIPIDDLAAEFRPPGDPQRIEEERTRLET
ncbi:MAG: hypothetical protein ACRD3M_04680, partial [Thermoanaerobaculia bacterium]